LRFAISKECTQKMKIAQVTSLFWPRKYGSNELFVCRELAKRGHEVTVLTADKPSNDYSMLAENSPKDEMFEGFRIRRFPTRLTFGNMLLIPDLLHFLMESDFDLINSHEFFAPCSFYSAIASKTKKTPLVVTQHNDQFFTSFSKNLLYYANACTIGKSSLRQARKIIALTKVTQSHLLFWGVPNNKISIVPTAVNTEVFSPGKQNQLKEKWGISSSIILYVGRFSEVKGIAYLLKAFPKIIESVPEAKLVLIGGGPLENEIKAFQNKFPGNVFYLPFVPNDIMPQIYAGCDVVILPSLEERFGNVALEAMACGKPVVGSCIGGLLDTVVNNETGLHIQPRNIAQLSDSIIRILKNDNLREEFGKNARERALKHFSYDVVMKLVEKVYQDAI
jgi:glycosyltransferase involved in cell wall biosynthesis